MDKELRKLPILIIGKSSEISVSKVMSLFPKAKSLSRLTFATDEYVIKAFGENAINLNNIRGYKPYYIIVQDDFPISHLVEHFLPLVEGDLTRIKFFNAKD